jgi:hypothetical protein
VVLSFAGGVMVLEKRGKEGGWQSPELGAKTGKARMMVLRTVIRALLIFRNKGKDYWGNFGMRSAAVNRPWMPRLWSHRAVVR